MRAICVLPVLFSLGLSQTAAARAQEGEATGEAGADSGGPTGPSSTAASIAELRQEYEKLRERLFTSRARSAAVGSAIYNAEVEISLTYDTGRFFAIRRATVRLDGSNVYDDREGAIAKDNTPRFSGFVAPGPHTMTVRVEAVAKDDARFATSSETTFTFDAPKDKRLHIKSRAKDDGDLAYNWNKTSSGSYQLSLSVTFQTQPRGQTP